MFEVCEFFSFQPEQTEVLFVFTSQHDVEFGLNQHQRWRLITVTSDIVTSPFKNAAEKATFEEERQ